MSLKDENNHLLSDNKTLSLSNEELANEQMSHKKTIVSLTSDIG